MNERQRRRFAAARAGLPPAPSSLANSSGIFLGEDFASDLARPGAALYGINPDAGPAQPDAPGGPAAGPGAAGAGHRDGRDRRLQRHLAAARPSRIATVGVGYADGWHRSPSGRGGGVL